MLNWPVGRFDGSLVGGGWAAGRAARSAGGGRLDRPRGTRRRSTPRQDAGLAGESESQVNQSALCFGGSDFFSSWLVVVVCWENVVVVVVVAGG